MTDNGARQVITLEKIKGLELEKLAQLVLDEADHNAAFNKRLKAAFAGQKGANELVKIIDRRLNSLQKAQGFIDWHKIKNFTDDLRALVTMIAHDLAPLDASKAMERLIAFLAMADHIYDRCDDSDGLVQDVYNDMVDKLAPIATKMQQEELDSLPEKITHALLTRESCHFYPAFHALCGLISTHALRQWDELLQEKESERIADKEAIPSFARIMHLQTINRARQLAAFTLQDVDGVVALEEAKLVSMRDVVGMASYLLKNNRVKEAYHWIGQKEDRRSQMEDYDNGHYACFVDEEYRHMRPSLRHACYEAKILEALGDHEAAQERRWACFQLRLSAEILRDYVAKLPDFEEFSVLDKVFDHAMHSDDVLLSLRFFMEWPRLDLASRFIVKNNSRWNGDDYHYLPQAAKNLEHEYPLAASILYRSLIDVILAKRRKSAYRYAATYCKKLRDLSSSADEEGKTHGFWQSHSHYMQNLLKTYPRTDSFWQLHDVR